MKHTLFAILALAAAAPAFAADIDVTPVEAVDCQKPTVSDVAWVNVQPTAADGTVTFDLSLSHGTCGAGQKTIAPIAENFRLDLAARDDGHDLESTAELTSPQSLHVRMSLRPADFFSSAQERTFDLAFHPDNGDVSYRFHVVVSRDPASGKVSLRMLDR